MGLRISLIDFLNAVPLQWGFLNDSLGGGDFEILSDVPSQCAERLASGAADVGLIPVIEYQRIPSLKILPGLSIASKKEVTSVLFVSRRPIETVNDIAVDESSRTSVALLQILLSEFFDNPRAEFHIERPHPEEMLARHEAALVIGNPALQVSGSDLIVYDLAHEWHRFTGLPFVFAFWAVRDGLDLGDDVRSFYRSRHQGIRNMDEIARIYSRRLGLSLPRVRTYLRENLNYSLDRDNLRGLERYYELARKWNLISTLKPLEFYDAQWTASDVFTLSDGDALEVKDPL